MSIKITPSVTLTEPTTSSVNVQMPVQNKGTTIFVPDIMKKDKSTYAVASHSIYQAALPTNINVIAKAVELIPSIKNSVVQKQTIKVLSVLNSSLLEAAGDTDIANRLPMMHLVEREDQSILLEWNFESFRIGFAIETQPEDSNYFIISEDKDAGSFSAETYRFRNNYEEIIKKIAYYTIRNT
jgi:hypothetical protein